MAATIAPNSLRWLLAAWTLATTLSAGGELVHCHPDGHLPHVHDGTGTVSSSFGACSCYHHQAAAETAVILPVCPGSHQHRFSLLLGTIDYRPGADEPDRPDDPRDGRHDALRALRPTVARHTAADAERFCLEVRDWTASPVLQASPAAVGTSGNPQLCDRARQERSGVLLA